MKKYDNIVYSTDNNFSYSKEDENDSALNLTPEEQHLRLHLKRLPGKGLLFLFPGFWFLGNGFSKTVPGFWKAVSRKRLLGR